MEQNEIYIFIYGAIWIMISVGMFYFAIGHGLIWLIRLPRCVRVHGYIRIREANEKDDMLIDDMDRIHTYTYCDQKMEQIFFNPKTQKEVIIDVTHLLGARYTLRKCSYIYPNASNQEISGWYYEPKHIVISLIASIRTLLIFGLLGSGALIIGIPPILEYFSL